MQTEATLNSLRGRRTAWESGSGPRVPVLCTLFFFPTEESTVSASRRPLWRGAVPSVGRLRPVAGRESWLSGLRADPLGWAGAPGVGAGQAHSQAEATDVTLVILVESSDQGCRFCRAKSEELCTQSGSAGSGCARLFWKASCCSCRRMRFACCLSASRSSAVCRLRGTSRYPRRRAILGEPACPPGHCCLGRPGSAWAPPTHPLISKIPQRLVTPKIDGAELHPGNCGKVR